MKLGIFGLGITGLVNYATYWNHRDSVVAYENNPEKVEAISRHPNSTWEASLRKIISKTKSHKSLTAKAEDLKDTNVFFFCEEPVYQPDGSLDMSTLEEDLAIAQTYRNKDDVYFVLRTLLPLGYTAALRAKLPTSIHLVVEPSFLSDLPYAEEMNPDRIILGVNRQEDAAFITSLRKREIQNHGIPVYEMDYASAELAPYVSLSFLRAKQSYANEVAMLCERYGGDVAKVLPSLGSDHRIGHSLLRVNPGYGNDGTNQALTAFESQSQFAPVASTFKANQSRIDTFLERIRTSLGNLSGKTIAIAGWPAMNGNAKDAIAWPYVKRLLEERATITVYEPRETRVEDASLGVTWAATFRDALAHADALLILAPEDCFKQLPEERLLLAMPGRWIFDGYDLYRQGYFREFHYVAVGH